MNKFEKLLIKREKLTKELYKVNCKIHFYNEINEQLPKLKKK